MSWASKSRGLAPQAVLAMLLALLLHLAVLAGATARHHYAVDARAGRPAPQLLTVRQLPASTQALRPTEAASPAPSRPPPDSASAAPAAVPLLQAPSVASGLSRGGAVLLPGLEAGHLKARFWIDAQGTVERVELSPHRYTEDEASQLLEALQLVRFHPARRKGIAVPAELTMDLFVTSGFGA